MADLAKKPKLQPRIAQKVQARIRRLHSAVTQARHRRLASDIAAPRHPSVFTLVVFQARIVFAAPLPLDPTTRSSIRVFRWMKKCPN
jgi:hypothetical protein